MKIKPKLKPSPETTDNFVDREIQRYAFQKHLTAIKNSGVGDGLLLTYSGVGGIGKTFLLNQFKKMANESKKNFVLHDFKSNADMVAVLKILRKKLSDGYQMQFPLFDKGCIYLAQKSGEFVSAEQQKIILQDTAAFRCLKKKVLSALNDKQDYLTSVNKISDKISDLFGDAFSDDIKNLLYELIDASVYAKASNLPEKVLVVDILKGIFSATVETSVFVKAVKPFWNLLQKRVKKFEEAERANGNETYGEILTELETRNATDEPAYIREFLPTLFAQDISYHLNETNTDLIIFLDTYEVLTGEELGRKKFVRLISENRDVPVDWWVGEILAADRVMWVIAGRYEINEIGEVTFDGGQIENYTVDVFEKNWADRYLQELGVAEENLRKGIVELTGGHPFYLHACSVTYKNKINDGKIPRLSDFGENRDKILERALGSFDDTSRLMLQSLCILGSWTDEIAIAVFSDFNPNTYSRLKKIFADEDEISADDDEFIIYNFNRTISAFLLPGLKQDVLFTNVFTKIRDAANVFFQKFFAENRRDFFFDDSKGAHYFKLWSKIILRTTDAPAELMTFFDENLAPIEYCFDNARRAEVAEKFFTKVGDTETLPSAYFQYLLGATKFYQGMDEDALELETSAYQKLQRLPLEKENRWLKIAATHCLADIFKNLKRWTDEINLREEIVAECENHYSDADDKRTVNAKENLTQALEHGDRLNDAIELHRRIVESLDGHDDEIFIQAAKNFAATLEFCNRHAEAVPVRKKIVDVYERIHDDEKVIDALWRLTFELALIPDAKALEEKLACYKKIYRLYEANGREIPADLVRFIADVLKKLGRDDEAAQVYKNFVDDLKRRVALADEPDEKNFKLMVSLADMMRLTLQFDEENLWQERATDALKFIVEQLCREPVKDYDTVISTLKDYSDFLDSKFYYEAQIVLWRKILALTEKNPAATDQKIIYAKNELMYHLRELIERKFKDEYLAEEMRLFEEIEAYYKKIFPKNFEDFLSAFLFLQILFLRIHLQDFPAAIEKHMEILDFLEKHPKATAKHIFEAMKQIAQTFNHEKNFSDEASWYERILIFCREHFMKDAPEVLETLGNLSAVYKNLRDYDKAERYQRILVDITEKKQGTEHSETIEEKERLARIFHDAGKFDEETVLREQIGETNVLLADDDPIDELIEELEALSDEEDADKASELLKKVEAMVREVKTLEPSDFK